jgi:general secretion pathway protein A
LLSARELRRSVRNHALTKAGNATLMTPQLRDALVDHCAGNYRLLMTMAGGAPAPGRGTVFCRCRSLTYGTAQEAAQLDEKLYLELFQPQRPTAKKKGRTQVK